MTMMMMRLAATPALAGIASACLLGGCGNPDRGDGAGAAAESAATEAARPEPADGAPDPLAESERLSAAAEKKLKALAAALAAGGWQGDAEPPPSLQKLAARFAGSDPSTRHSEIHTFGIAHDAAAGTFHTESSLELKAELEGGGWFAAAGEIAADWRAGEDGVTLLAVRCDEATFDLAESPSPWFRDRTEEVIGAQPAFRHQLAHGLDHWLQRVEADYGFDAFIRNGMAVGDADGDGRDDLYICQPGGLPNRLFLQRGDGAVAAAPAASAAAEILDHTASALFADLDNDGDQDLTLATPAGLVLFRNDGAAAFAEVGTLRTDGADLHALSAADFDLDGDLDLFVTCALGIVFEGETGGAFRFHDARDGGYNQLFRNDGGWSFSERTRASGLAEGNDRHSLAAGWCDYDLDGDPDLYVANDYGPNQLFRNDPDPGGGGRSFTEVAAGRGVEDRGAGMSVAWGDFDRDGTPDLYVGNMFSNAGSRLTGLPAYRVGGGGELLAIYRRFAAGNTLFRGGGGGSGFAETPFAKRARWAWSSVFADLDNDGWEDLFVANGYLTGPLVDDL